MKIELRTLNDQAYDEIRAGLISGRFRPGQPLVIRSLADMFGTSITPVRDALQRLVAERQLEMLPNRTIAVPRLNAGTFVELARIRTALEGLAGEMAAPALAGSDQIRSLSKLIDRSEEAIRRRDGATYAGINQRFHFGIYASCGSPVLLRMITDLWSQVGPFFACLLDCGAYNEIANDQHREILAAIEAQDPAAVRRHIEDDISSATRALSACIESQAGRARPNARPGTVAAALSTDASRSP